MLEQLRNMIQVITKEMKLPSWQFLDAEICLLMHVQPIVSQELTKIVQLYVRSIMDARFRMIPTGEIHRQFVNTMEAFGGLTGDEIRPGFPYVINKRGAPQDLIIKGSKRTLLQMTAEKFVYARAEAALRPMHGDIMDEITRQEFQYNFRNEMTKVRLQYDYQTLPPHPAYPETPVLIAVDIYLPGHMNAHRFNIAINLHGEILLDVNRDGYDAAFTLNQNWLPAY